MIVTSHNKLVGSAFERVAYLEVFGQTCVKVGGPQDGNWTQKDPDDVERTESSDMHSLGVNNVEELSVSRIGWLEASGCSGCVPKWLVRDTKKKVILDLIKIFYK